MKDDLFQEVKELNGAFKKKFFSMKKNGDNEHPRPLQISIIDYLFQHPKEEICQKDLENHFHISKAAISDVLNTMEKNGMIERVSSLEDARKNQILLTKKTMDLHQDYLKDWKKLNEEIHQVLSEKEIKDFMRISHKIKDYLVKEETYDSII